MLLHTHYTTTATTTQAASLTPPSSQLSLRCGLSAVLGMKDRWIRIESTLPDAWDLNKQSHACFSILPSMLQKALNLISFSICLFAKKSLTTPIVSLQIFAYGMLCAAIAIALVLFIATYLKQAVSTTHTASEYGC